MYLNLTIGNTTFCFETFHETLIIQLGRFEFCAQRARGPVKQFITRDRAGEFTVDLPKLTLNFTNSARWKAVETRPDVTPGM